MSGCATRSLFGICERPAHCSVPPTLQNHHTLPQIQVEVINGDHFDIPTLFPIHSTAELAIAFHHLKDDIVRLLEETLRTKWQPAPQPIR
ncbi:hypothetical protein N7501_011325 [Penicillium viridicatum]|nr:hypothetical protein N7501_011325 [Penicillium viridicatum]